MCCLCCSLAMSLSNFLISRAHVCIIERLASYDFRIRVEGADTIPLLLSLPCKAVGSPESSSWCSCLGAASCFCNTCRSCFPLLLIFLLVNQKKDFLLKKRVMEMIFMSFLQDCLDVTSPQQIKKRRQQEMPQTRGHTHNRAMGTQMPWHAYSSWNR